MARVVRSVIVIDPREGLDSLFCLSEPVMGVVSALFCLSGPVVGVVSGTTGWRSVSIILFTQICFTETRAVAQFSDSANLNVVVCW